MFESTQRDVRPFFVGFWIPSDRETRFSLSLNQLWVGVKRYWTYKRKSSPPVKGESTPTPSLPVQGGGSKGGGAVPSPPAGVGEKVKPSPLRGRVRVGGPPKVKNLPPDSTRR